MNTRTRRMLAEALIDYLDNLIAEYEASGEFTDGKSYANYEEWLNAQKQPDAESEEKPLDCLVLFVL